MADSNRSKARILVVDDEAGARSALTELLRDEDYEVRSAGDGYKALGQIEGWTPDVVLTDLRMPGLDGLALMERLQTELPDTPVIVVTAFGSVESAVSAMHRGAADYVTKPINLDHLLLVLQRVLEHQELKREASRMRDVLREGDRPGGLELVGRSKAFADLMDLARQVASSNASVLISGESGTGKELLARALHDWSSRAGRAFCTLRCGALSEEVLDAELFGHAGGSVASPSSRPGMLAACSRGTLFIDEVGRMPAGTQVKLLRYIQDSAGRTPSGGEPDVRIIAAAEQDLHRAVEDGQFREDLFYRLNVINLRVPSLQERRDDIAPLATHFLRKYTERARKPITGLSERALGVLVNYSWPGNVRQLENCIEHAVAVCDTAQIEPRHLPRELMATTRSSDEMPRVPGASLAELEKYAIFRTLEHTNGSTSKAARILGISPRKIQYRLREYREATEAGGGESGSTSVAASGESG